MAGLGGIFSSAGSSAEQLFIWQVLGSIISAVLAPVVQEVQQKALGELPNTPLDPSVAAALVAQTLLSLGDGEAEAKLSGVDGARFDNLVTAAGSTLDMGAVVAAFQRNLIPVGSFDPTDVSLQGAMASAAIRESWSPILQSLAVAIPSIAEVMNAWLEGQITQDEAEKRYLAAGGDPTWFQTSYNANGQAPTPVEALEMLNRGIITETGTGPDAVTYQQAFLEGPWRNKWLSSFEQLRNYLPPPRTVTAMYHDGQLTQAQAADYLTKQGLTADLVAAYLSPVTKTTTTTAKTLAEAQIIGLYTDQIITTKQATDYLVALKYPPDQAALLIELADFKTQATALTAGVGQVKTLFQAGKLTQAEAVSELESLNIDGTTAKALIQTWNVTQRQAVKTLSAAQIVDAWYYTLYDVDEAMTALQGIGYDELDSYILLAIKNKAQLPGVPLPSGVQPPVPPPVIAPVTPPA